MTPIFAASILDPIVHSLSWLVLGIDRYTHNLGLSLVVLALLIRLVFWKLNVAQFKAMISMQKVAPEMKKVQARYKDDSKKLQEETMKLYKEHNVNPLAGCLPMLVQLPILFSVYWVVILHRTLYAQTTFLWVGTALSAHFPKILAQNLAQPDLLLIVLYMISQYISLRFTTMPATDPQQANTNKIMQIVSPLMLGVIGFRTQWPSAMVLYWLSYNVLTMAQQFYMLRQYHEPLGAIDSDRAITTDDGVAAAVRDIDERVAKTSKKKRAASSPALDNGSVKKKGAKP